MRKANLTDLYTTLTPDERFKLLLTALARGDEDDAWDIAHSCPKKNYSMSDAAYSDRLDTCRDIALFCSLEWLLKERAYSASKAILTMNRFAHDSYLTGYLAGCGNDADMDAAVDKAYEHTVDVRQEYVAMHNDSQRQLKSLLSALEIFCRDIDVPIEHMFYWFPPTIGWINDTRTALQDVQPDAEAMDYYLSTLRGYWTEATGEAIDTNKRIGAGNGI